MRSCRGTFGSRVGFTASTFYVSVSWPSGEVMREEIALKCIDTLPERPTNPIVLTVETAPRYLAQALGVCLDASVSIGKANAELRPTTNGIEPSDLDGRDVLVVADVLSSGESIRPLVELAKRRKSVSVHLVAFAALHRDGCGAILRKLDVSGTCLMHAAWATYDRDACPLCDAGGELLSAFELN